MKKKILIGCIIAVVLIGLITAVVIVNTHSSKDLKIENEAGDSEYPFTLVQQTDGTLQMEIAKGEYTKGSWRIEPEYSDYYYVQYSKGRKDTFVFTSKMNGFTEISFVLNDGEKDVYKIVCNYSAGSSMQSVLYSYGTEFVSDVSFGSEDTVPVKCYMKDSANLTVEITTEDKYWEADFDSEYLSLLFDRTQEGKLVLNIYALQGGKEVPVTLSYGNYSIKLNIRINDDCSLMPLSTEVVPYEPVSH